MLNPPHSPDSSPSPRKRFIAAATLSWADTIAIAGSAAVEAVGGPSIRVRLGRKDALEADPADLSKPKGKCDEATVAGGGRDCRGLAEKTIPGAGLNSDGESSQRPEDTCLV